MRPVSSRSQNPTSEIISELEAELGSLQRQQRALHLVTAARQVVGMLDKAWSAAMNRCFSCWRGVIMAGKTARMQANHLQGDMQQHSMLWMKRCIALSQAVVLPSVSLIRVLVTNWAYNTRAHAMNEERLTHQRLLQQHVSQAKAAQQQLGIYTSRIKHLEEKISRLSKADPDIQATASHQHNPQLDKTAHSIRDLLSLMKSGKPIRLPSSDVQRLLDELASLEETSSKGLRLSAELRAANNALFLYEEEIRHLSKQR